MLPWLINVSIWWLAHYMLVLLLPDHVYMRFACFLITFCESHMCSIYCSFQGFFSAQALVLCYITRRRIIGSVYWASNEIIEIISASGESLTLKWNSSITWIILKVGTGGKTRHVWMFNQSVKSTCGFLYNSRPVVVVHTGHFWRKYLESNRFHVAVFFSGKCVWRGAGATYPT